ncbi:MAG: hypothetical protein JO046_10330 [Solirubrobacterales bacterium]|nr:hypothetical protein [Solirubrobacterales bacterium]
MVAGIDTCPYPLAALIDAPESLERFGSINDNTGKLALLYDIARVAPLLHDGDEPFHPDRDRAAFTRHLLGLGCQPPSPQPAG